MTKLSSNKPPTLRTERLLLAIALVGLSVQSDVSGAQAPVLLRSTAQFAVLAGTTVTSLPLTTINGDLGVYPGSTLTGAPVVTGSTHLADPISAQAQLDLTTAYNDAAGRSMDAITVSGNLGGETLAPGLYKSGTSLEISSGDLTLDAQGNPNGVWIFQMGTTFITTVGRQIVLSGGARAENVFWQVGSSATLGSDSVIKGTIMADQSITLDTGAVLEGRALARNGAVTFDMNTVNVPDAAITDVVLVSAAGVTDSFEEGVEHSVDLQSKTITLLAPSSSRFYRIKANPAVTIEGIAVDGENLVISYY